MTTRNTPPQQASGRRWGESAGAVAAGGLGAVKEDYLMNGLEGTQVLRFRCRCCKSINVLMCSRTSDGRWQFRHADAPLPATTVVIEEAAETACPAPLLTPLQVCRDTPNEAERASEPGASGQQAASVQGTIRPVPGCTPDRVYSKDNNKNSACSGRRDREDDVLGATSSGEETSAAAEGRSTAEPATKRDASGNASASRSLPAAFSASTSVSWQSEEGRGGDEGRTPSEETFPQGEALQETKRVTDSLQQKQKQRQPVKAGVCCKEKRGPVQHEDGQTEVDVSYSVRSATPERGSSEESRVENGAGAKQPAELRCTRDISHHPRMQADALDKEAAVAPAVKQQRHPQQREESEQPVGTQLGGEKPEKSQQASSGCRSVSGENGSGTGASRPTVLEISAAMKADMVTREIQGDGNCLYRAFSDQLYGSQDYHLFLRKLAADVMSRRRATFEAFVDDSEGPFERWLQTKRTYGEWGDYREMHALLLLFGTPIFVFDERLDLLQAFEPEEEQARFPLHEGRALTPFRLVWHGKRGHYSSLHYLRETFPIACGHKIGDLEAEGLARLIVCEDSGTVNAPEGDLGRPGGICEDIEDETLAKCLEVSAEELPSLAAEQKFILAAIKKQRVQQLLPETTRVVLALWHEAKEEQEKWNARLARAPSGPPGVFDGGIMQQRSLPWSAVESHSTAAATTRAATLTAAATTAAPANVRTSAPPFRPLRQAVSEGSFSPFPPCNANSEERSAAGAVQNTVVYRPSQQDWQRQRIVAATSNTTLARVPPAASAPSGVSSQMLTNSPEAPPTAERSFLYRQQRPPVTSHQGVVDQHRQCVVRLADGRLMRVNPSTGYQGGALRPAMLLQRGGDQRQQRGNAAEGEDRRSSGASQETSWFSRWMVSSNGNKGG